MTALAQQMRALAAGDEVRGRKARLRRHLRGNPDELARVLLEPPEEIRGLTVLEVLACSRSDGMRAAGVRSISWLAARERGLSVAEPVGAVSPDDRAWLAEHAVRSMPRRRLSA